MDSVLLRLCQFYWHWAASLQVCLLHGAVLHLCSENMITRNPFLVLMLTSNVYVNIYLLCVCVKLRYSNKVLLSWNLNAVTLSVQSG